MDKKEVLRLLNSANDDLTIMDCANVIIVTVNNCNGFDDTLRSMDNIERVDNIYKILKENAYEYFNDNFRFKGFTVIWNYATGEAMREDLQFFKITRHYANEECFITITFNIIEALNAVVIWLKDKDCIHIKIEDLKNEQIIFDYFQ